jgi:DNA replication protein DnaC
MACYECGGIGLLRRYAGDHWVSVRCSCQAGAAEAARIHRAQIPAGFDLATLENFRPSPHTRDGLMFARRFAEEFLPANNRTDQPPGLLLHGSVGTGKTHLATGTARAIAARGFQPLFVDVRELLERLRRSYDPGAQETTAQIFAPIWAADLVVIDELGAQRPTEWSFETIELLIGGLYNRVIATIVTTNLPNLAGAEGDTNAYARAARRETLSDRIGARMWSRLQQMCRPVEMTGPDWRTRR